MAAVASEKMVDSTPTSSPPISQSMDNHDSSGRFSGDSDFRSPATDASNRSSSSTPSPSRQLDTKSQPLSRVEEYRQLFRLPPDEVLIQDFNCALQENFLLQGHMYLFVHCICFYSNLFGFETKKIIPFQEVTSVRRAKAVAVFPTAIEIIAGEKRYFFTSFLSRDEAFRLIINGWQQHGGGSEEIADQPGPKSDISRQENDSAITEDPVTTRQSMDELEASDNGPISDDSQPFGDCEPDIVPTSSTVPLSVEERSEAAHSNGPSSSEKPSAWQPEDVDAPGVPECYTKVAESKFPIQVEEFFNLFFSDDGIDFQESFHKKCGDKDFKCTLWRPHEKFGQTRNVSFQHPIKIYFGARFGSCQEAQKYSVYRNCHLIVETSQEISDVPYGDYFTVEVRWDVERENCNDSKSGCMLNVYLNVAFSRKTMWKGKIVQSTLEECREAYATWIDLAHEVLKQKHLEKEEVGRVSNSNDQVRLENQLNTHLEPKESDTSISQNIPELKDVNQQVRDYPQGRNLQDTSIGSLLRENFTKYISSLKDQNMTSLLPIIAIAIILLLMQMSILVLLSRPQRIHVIPQADCKSSMLGLTENRVEAVASLNRQIKYLKEEMHLVETLLEKLQHEHALLKGKLKELEFFRN